MGEWISIVKNKVRHLTDITETEKKDWEKRSIYKLPTYVTYLNENAYKPQAISFGPYHFGEPNLRPMEVHKERALLHFLNRSVKPLDDYVRALGEILQDLKDAYSVLEDRWLNDSDAFLELMLRDGCFMIEILRASATGNQTGEAGYAPNDPIFSAHGKLYALPLLKRDMLMLENQLPMLLLETLLAVNNQDQDRQIDIETGEGTRSGIQTGVENINTLIHRFYFSSNRAKELGTCMHVLDAYRKILLCTATNSRMQDLPLHSTGLDDNDIFSVTELEDAGIRIKRSRSTSLKAIYFNPKSGILLLPRIVVDDVSETMFLNLVAFERFHVGAGNEVTDYICFMDDIIDNATDVHRLERRGIIQNAIGSDKAVAQLFNSLTKDVSLSEDSDSTKVRRAINHYRKTKIYRKWRADLKENYFRSPWALISVVAAIVLFALTIAQTVYSGLQYQQGANDSPPPPPPRSHRS